MQDVAVYYPYIHIQDDTWLKAAALYLPHIGRISPQGYPVEDSQTAQALKDGGFLIDIDPFPYGEDTAFAFMRFVQRNRNELRSRFTAVPQAAPPPGPFHRRPGSTREQLIEWVDAQHKGMYIAADELTALGLSVSADDDQGRRWLGMHPQLARVFLAALAQQIADRNGTTVVTDQPGAPEGIEGWTTDAIAAEVLDLLPRSHRRTRTVSEVASMYAVLAVKAVVPAGLETLPVERIVAVRIGLRAEFDAFYDHLNSLTDAFANLSGTEDPQILSARLERLADRHIRRPLAELKRGLRGLRLEPAQAILGTKSFDIPAVASAAVSAVGIPEPAGQAGLVAARFISSAARAHATAQQQRHGAAGYLLGIHEQLYPRTLTDRLLRRNRRPPLELA